MITKNDWTIDLGVLEARFEHTTQSEHDEIEWPSEEIVEIEDREEKKKITE